MGGLESNHDYYSRQLVHNRSKDEAYENWTNLLREYAEFNSDSFSVATDILPALSGLAAHFNIVLQDDYLAGLWRGNLLNDLMWCRIWDLPSRPAYFLGLAQSPESYLVPSWSSVGRGDWESLKFQAWTGAYSEFQKETEILDASTELVGKNRFGAIKNGQLCIRSHVLGLASLDQAKLRIAQVKDQFGIVIHVLRYGGKDVGKFWLDFDSGEADMLDDIVSFTWILLGSCKAREFEKETKARQSHGAFGLILHPVPNSVKFHRVGVFSLDFSDEHGDGLRLYKGIGELRTVIVI
ncbi:hypothetical protein GQ53DRAFT_822153 [Thozetella sp. PMI_491]|nr:hypothetical protein GQ53DRAFT_822153 [Thozetella sp. PMI_491]